MKTAFYAVFYTLFMGFCAPFLFAVDNFLEIL